MRVVGLGMSLKKQHGGQLLIFFKVDFPQLFMNFVSKNVGNLKVWNVMNTFSEKVCSQVTKTMRKKQKYKEYVS